MNDFELTIVLADAAESTNGKYSLLGGGWVITTGVAPSALVVAVQVPWARANEKHQLVIELVNADGQGAAGTPFPITSEFEVGRRPGLPIGCTLDHNLVINMPALPLPDGAYEWKVTINGETRDHWRRTFYVQRPPEARLAS